MKLAVVTLLFLVYFLPANSVVRPPDWWIELHGWEEGSDWTDKMTYTTSFFGPNAFPVPEIQNAKLPDRHSVEVSSDVFWGFGDETQSLSTKLSYVFIPGRLVVSGWGVLFEHYKTTTEVRDSRASIIEDAEENIFIGDFYISTLISLVKEKKYFPALNLDLVLKTSSSSSPKGARFFDTPGYFFNLTAGKSQKFSNSFFDELRLTGNIGFLCYQTNKYYQNDAPLYGFVLDVVSGNFTLQNTVAGYSGWLKKGDRPKVYRAKLTYKTGGVGFFTQYQHSLRDYPFKRLQTGLSIDF